MRTSAQRKKRSVVYRILNVVFILVGVGHLAITLMNRGSVVYGVSYLKRPQRGSSAAFEARSSFIDRVILRALAVDLATLLEHEDELFDLSRSRFRLLRRLHSKQHRIAIGTIQSRKEGGRAR